MKTAGKILGLGAAIFFGSKAVALVLDLLRPEIAFNLMGALLALGTAALVVAAGRIQRGRR